MGNVLSRCVQEVRDLWRNCRSREGQGGRAGGPGAPKAQRGKEHVGEEAAPNSLKDRVPLLPEAPGSGESGGDWEAEKGGLLLDEGLCQEEEEEEEVIVPRIEKQELRRLYTLSEARLGSIVSQDNEGGQRDNEGVGDNDDSEDNDEDDEAAGESEGGEDCTCSDPDRPDQSPSGPCCCDSAKAGGDADAASRQDAVLRKLGRLEQEVEKLCQVYGVQDASTNSAHPSTSSSSASTTSRVSSSASTSKVSGSPLTLNGVPLEVVVNADPASPPYSVLVLCEMLSEHYKVLISTFTHSSAGAVPPSLQQLGSRNPTSRSHQLGISLVWKQVPHGPSLMVSPQKQSAILGEANIARYLARLLDPAYDAGDPITATQIDEWLDTAQVSLVCGTNKERMGALRAMNSTLGRRPWLVGGKMTLADVVVWSAVQRCGLASEAPNNVKQWLQACMSHALFQQAACVLAG